MNANKSIFSTQFILLCLSGFLFFSSFNIIIPELPSFLDKMGGGEYKGFIIGLFTITAGLSRPLSGKLSDKIGRIPVMVVGAVVSGIAALFYPYVITILAFFALRLFHGFSAGFKPTGTSAYVADIVPANKRGEAMGYIGFFSSMGMAAGPAIGSWIAANLTLNIMFYTSCSFAILSVLVLLGMKESLVNKEPWQWSHLYVKRDEIFEPKVLKPSIIMFFACFPFGAMVTLVPDMTDHFGFGNRGMYFTYFTIASLLVRIVAGKGSDKFGRVLVLKIGTTMLLLSMLVLANVTQEWTFILSAILFGFGTGICSPTIFAWTIDLSDDQHRGRAVATMFIFLELGIGTGAFISGWLYNNTFENVPVVFYLAALFVLIANLYLYSNSIRKLKQLTP